MLYLIHDRHSPNAKHHKDVSYIVGGQKVHVHGGPARGGGIGFGRGPVRDPHRSRGGSDPLDPRFRKVNFFSMHGPRM